MKSAEAGGDQASRRPGGMVGGVHRMTAAAGDPEPRPIESEDRRGLVSRALGPWRSGRGDQFRPNGQRTDELPPPAALLRDTPPLGELVPASMLSVPMTAVTIGLSARRVALAMFVRHVTGETTARPGATAATLPAVAGTPARLAKPVGRKARGKIAGSLVKFATPAMPAMREERLGTVKVGASEAFEENGTPGQSETFGQRRAARSCQTPAARRM